ncbi:MAG: PAS domain S-box protein, partial [Puniceicoccales bacterium]
IQDTTERRKAEEALVRERMRLENILSGTHVGTWEWNVQTGEISVNERWGEILGYRIEEISPLSYEMWQSLCHPDDYKNALKSLEKHLAGEAAYYGSEIRMRNKEGQWVWVLDRGRIGSLDEEGRPVWVYGTSLDVSGLKETEDLLQRNLSLLKSLLDSIPDMIFYKDLEGNYLDCNVEFSKFTNQSLKEIRGKTDYDLFPRQLANEFRENDRIVKESGKPRQNMEWLTYPDGRTYLYSMLKAPFRGPDGDIQGVLGVGRDITQQHQDEGKIRLQALVLEQIQDCVMVMDLQGVVTYVNHAVVQTLGYHQSELLGSLVTNFDESSEDYLNMIEILHIALDKGIWEGEISKTTAKGQRKEFFSRWQVVRNETEEIVALCAVFTEITERKKFEAALIQAKETAEAANEAKNVFLATMSHELRTPLNPIFGFTELLMEEENLSEEQKSWLAVIQSRSKDLLLLIEDILNIARIEAGSFIIEAKPTRIQDIFDDIKSIFEQSCQEKGLTLVMELEDELEMLCLIDPARTRQILLNLVGNAIKFSESGQIYVLANRNLVQEEHLSVGEVHFMVRDNGPGIPLKDHDLVFRDFQQLDSSDSRRFEGAGLGLAICKRLVNLMGGEIWIDEDYQNGAEFHVRFPAPLYGEDMDEELNAGAGLKLDEGWPAGKPEMENRPARVIEEDKEGRSVLLVEDDLNSAKIMIADLERKNYQVTHAEDGQTALDMCRSSRYNVILMDLKMPGMGGFEVSRVLRRRGDNTPIVAVNVRAFGTKDTDDLYNPGVGGDPANPIEQRNLWSIIDEAIKNGRG